MGRSPAETESTMLPVTKCADCGRELDASYEQPERRACPCQIICIQ